MKICIYGAGAIGGYLGVQLARAGVDVSLVARGAHLAAMRANGLKLLIGDEERVVHPRCTDNPAELGPQDFVIVCLKAHSITGVIEQMQPLLGAHTRIVTAVNGIPYWYFYRHGGAYQGSTLESIDPGGRQWRELTPQRAIGCIVYPATEIEAPGVIRHVYGDRFPLGEPSGETTGDVRRLAEVFVKAGMQAPVLDRIRDEIWLTLVQCLPKSDQRADTCDAGRDLLRSRHARHSVFHARRARQREIVLRSKFDAGTGPRGAAADPARSGPARQQA
jgi:2-dehydropantoate 2-reductase